MKIKQRIQLSTSIIFFIIIVIATVFFVRSITIQRSEERLTRFTEVSRQSILLFSLTQEYAQQPSTENQREWLATQKGIQNILNEPSLAVYQDRVQFQTLLQSDNTISALFTEIVQEIKSSNSKQRLSTLEADILSHVKNLVTATARMEKDIFLENELAGNRTTIILFVALGILFAVAVGVYVYIARTVSEPLTKLTDVIKRARGGDPSVLAPSKGDDEISTLGREFNRMWTRLSTQTKELGEAKVKDEVLVNKLEKRIIELGDARKAMANLLQDFGEGQRILAEGRAKDSAYLENIGDGMIVVDKEKKIMVINKAAEDLLELKRDDVLGKKYYEVFQNQDSAGTLIPPDRRPITYVLNTGNKFVFPRPESPTTNTHHTAQISNEQVYYVKKSGIKFPIALIITPVVVNGEIIGAVDIFRDISKEKEIEKLRTDFLALASHQLRTPLSGTKWLIETIRRGITGVMNPKQNEYLDQIYMANERMIALVYDMLDVLKLEGTVTPVTRETVSIVKIYNELMSAIEAESNKGGVAVHNLVANNSPIEVVTDAAIIKLIIECFISNAIHYSKKGQEAFIDAKEEEGSVILSVRDQGIGIPKDETKRIFERFYRASNAKRFIPEGTGLGLYRAALLALKIGAVITFESEENKGTTFYLKLSK